MNSYGQTLGQQHAKPRLSPVHPAPATPSSRAGSWSQSSSASCPQYIQLCLGRGALCRSQRRSVSVLICLFLLPRCINEAAKTGGKRSLSGISVAWFAIIGLTSHLMRQGEAGLLSAFSSSTASPFCFIYLRVHTYGYM